MRILYDAFWWGSGPASNREVMRETFRAWVEATDDEFVLFTRHRHGETVRQEASEIAGKDIPVVTTRVAPHALALLIVMQVHALRPGYDAIFTQNFSIRARNSYVFLHDVLFMSNPEWFSWVERCYFALMSLTARRARRVFTSSQSEAARIRRHLHLRSVSAVGLGPRQSMLRAKSEAPPVPLRAGSFMLTVGRFNVRKNLARVVEAALLSERVSAAYPLVVVGDVIPEGSVAHVGNAISGGQVISLGFVSDGQLRWLYENCGTFVMASLGEGFGMPVAEAATFRRTSVLSGLDVFREIADGGYEADPLDVTSIMQAIQRAVDHPRPTELKQSLSWPVVADRIRLEIGASQ